jgi:hypothetical protein
VSSNVREIMVRGLYNRLEEAIAGFEKKKEAFAEMIRHRDKLFQNILTHKRYVLLSGSSAYTLPINV